MSDHIAYGAAGLGKSYAWHGKPVGHGNRLECITLPPLSVSRTLAELAARILERLPEQRRACEWTPGDIRGHRETSAAAVDITSRLNRPKEQQ